MSTNIMCVKCRHWFNYTPILEKLEDLNRVEPTDAEKAMAATAAKSLADQATLRRFAEGAEAFRQGRPIGPCAGASDNPYIDPEATGALRRSAAYGSYAEPYANIDRLAGYMEAMAAEVRELRRLISG
jgi:hypothetical protein